MTTTIDFITALFCQVDDHLSGLPKHPDARLWPSEVVTLGLLHALKGVGNRAFYRWLTRDYRTLFPRLPERTRLFRLFVTDLAFEIPFEIAPPSLPNPPFPRPVPQGTPEVLPSPIRSGMSRRRCAARGWALRRRGGGGVAASGGR
jgi:hypothetical protein